MFGNRLVRDFGESVPEIWRSAISSLNDHQIAKGLRVLSAHGSGSPPTLPQFMKSCKTIGDEEGTPRQAPTYEALPDGRDHFDLMANQELLKFLIRETVNSNQLPALMAIKNQAACDHRLLASEEIVEDLDFRKYLCAQFKKAMQAKAA